MTDVSPFADLIARDHGLCVLSTLRSDGSTQSSVVNAGVLPHPVTGDQVVGLVAIGGSRKLRNLRSDPRATVVAGAGWEWASLEGEAELIGRGDPHRWPHGVHGKVQGLTMARCGMWCGR